MGSNLSGVAVVTGGASGIDLACCRELAQRGATIALVDRRYRRRRRGGTLRCAD